MGGGNLYLRNGGKFRLRSEGNVLILFLGHYCLLKRTIIQASFPMYHNLFLPTSYIVRKMFFGKAIYFVRRLRL